MRNLLDRWMGLFRELRPDSQMDLEAVYADAIRFSDPLHEIEGLEALGAYFERLNRGLVVARFEYEAPIVEGSRAALQWTMELTLQRMPKRVIRVRGASVLEADGGRVTSQRDHFDVGAMVYEQVPVLGAAVRSIKRRVG